MLQTLRALAVLALATTAAWIQGEGPSKPVLAPVPGEAALKKAEALVRDVYRPDLADADTPSKQLALAGRLVDEAVKTDDDPAARFALLRMAREMAVRAGDAELIVRAVDETALHFEIDAAATKKSALTEAAASPRNSAVARALAEACTRLMDQAVREDRLDAAMDYGQAAYTAAGSAKDRGLVNDIVARGRQILALKKESQRAAEAAGVLARKPDDPEANLACGRYACLVKEDWAHGLPMLAKGSDPQWKAAAEMELAGPTEAARQIALADAWWEAAQDKSDPEKTALLGRAARWYRLAQPSATGLDKAKATSRLAQLRGFTPSERPSPQPQEPQLEPKPGSPASKPFDAAVGQWADVLGQIDLKKHRLAGDWQFKSGKLLAAPAGNAAAGLIVPVAPRGSYELEIQFTRLAGEGMIGVILPAGARRAMAVLDCQPGVHGLDMIQGRRADNNDSTTRGALNNGRQYTLEISVGVDGSDASITVNLDNRPLFFYRGPADALDLHKDFAPKDRTAPALVARSGVAFHSVRLRMKSGKASLLP
jgi:hypothetical protein